MWLSNAITNTADIFKIFVYIKNNKTEDSQKHQISDICECDNNKFINNKNNFFKK